MGKPADLNGDSIQDWHDLLIESEQVYRIEDKNEDGIADYSQLVASGFQDEVTDIAGAVLHTDDALFLGVAPDLWRLRDKNGDGIMDDKESISHGFQVHIGFGGHNLSGLIMGPDGRLYWGIGDIGFNGVDQSGNEWSFPNEGVIARCNPDGSDFEIFAHGLRNTHEFVFDEYGNMISVDNDGDHPGESERIVYLVDGSDSGWRINWQFGKYNDPDNNSYKVWMDEGMYLPRHEDQAAFFIPCIRNYINGPTGMVYNPGTALGKEWLDYFFVVEFNGNPARSGIHAFQLKEEGAGFAFVGDRKVATGILATGLDVGADGALYFTDWIDGWEKKGYGRIWKLDVKEQSLAKERQETQMLLGADFKDKEASQLRNLLAHQDMRVRQKTQFELVNRAATPLFESVLQHSDAKLSRIHALWGIAQLVRAGSTSGEKLIPYLTDEDAEIRAQTCKMLGDVRFIEAGKSLVSMLSDTHARVQFFAAEALGRIAFKPAVEALLELLERNDDQDVYLRHAASLALARIGEVEPLVALAESESRALRIAAVIALRRLQSDGLKAFLKDEDEYIVAEAARAINDDLSVESALPDLGKLLANKDITREAIIRRAINANLRIGSTEALKNVLDFILDSGRGLEMRIEGIQSVGTWIKPSVVDRVDGRYRGVFNRQPDPVQQLAGPILARLLRDPSVKVRLASLKSLAKLKIMDQVDDVVSTLNQDADADVRSESLRTLAFLDQQRARGLLKQVLGKGPESVKIAALELIGEIQIDPKRIEPELNAIITKGSNVEKQAAISALGLLPQQVVDDQVKLLLDQLANQKLEASLQLDLLEVASKSENGEIIDKIKAFRMTHSDKGIIAEYLECLEGGDPKKGQDVLVRNSAAQCLKCHAIRGYGGVAGPPLDGVGDRLDRHFLLESLIDPSAHLAAGYGVVTAILNNDQAVSGILESENETELIIKNSSGEDVAVKKNDIKERINALSSMPAMGSILSKREIRDLIAFLSSFKSIKKIEGEGAL